MLAVKRGLEPRTGISPGGLTIRCLLPTRLLDNVCPLRLVSLLYRPLSRLSIPFLKKKEKGGSLSIGGTPPRFRLTLTVILQQRFPPPSIELRYLKKSTKKAGLCPLKLPSKCMEVLAGFGVDEIFQNLTGNSTHYRASLCRQFIGEIAIFTDVLLNQFFFDQ